MSQKADRFRNWTQTRKPTISAEKEIAEQLEAMAVESADHLATLADLDYDFSGQLIPPEFLNEDNPHFALWLASARRGHRSTNALFLDMIYDEETERQEREENEYDRRCEDAAADRYEFGYERY